MREKTGQNTALRLGLYLVKKLLVVLLVVEL